MTLVSSGEIHLIGSSAAPTRSINFELDGDYTGPIHLATAGSTAGFSAPIDMSDFYGYSACSAPGTPNCSANWIMTGVIQVTFIVYDDYDGVDIQYSTNNSTWYNLTTGYTGSSPYSTTTSCSNTYYRVRAYKDCGSGNLYSDYSSSSWAGSCP